MWVSCIIDFDVRIKLVPLKGSNSYHILALPITTGNFLQARCFLKIKRSSHRTSLYLAAGKFRDAGILPGARLSFTQWGWKVKGT